MAFSKTRALLVEVAKELFAKKGVADTTMNDIASASGKGRRTLYTYFKNKEEIYLACIETEILHIISNLQTVMKSDAGPEEKLKDFVRVHLDVLKDAVIRNGNLHARFFSDIVEVERARRKLDQKEMLMLTQLLSEGQEQGLFCVRDSKQSAQLLLFTLKGLEVSYIRDSAAHRRQRLVAIYDFLFYGLKGKILCQPSSSGNEISHNASEETASDASVSNP
jgi:AcrR family transcriptional regulator